MEGKSLERRDLDLRHKLSEQDRLEIVQRKMNGESQVALGRAYSVDPSTISRLLRRYFESVKKEIENGN